MGDLEEKRHLCVHVVWRVPCCRSASREVHTAHTCRLHVLVLVWAVLRDTLRRACRTAFTHSFIHIPPWCVSQGGYVCGSVVCVYDAGAWTCTQCALSV